VDVPQVFYAVDAQPVRLVDEQGASVVLQRPHNLFLAAGARMTRGVFAAAYGGKQGLQKGRLAPALPDMNQRPAAFLGVALRRNALTASGLPVGKDEPGQPVVGCGHFIHRVVKAAHGFGFDNDFAHVISPEC